VIERNRVEQFGGDVTVKDVSVDEKLERYALHLAAALQPGEAKLTMDFTGTLNDKLWYRCLNYFLFAERCSGFYRSTYEVDGQKRVIATTQFEAVDARKAFPCWDEPSFKATFAVTLDIPNDMTALSNMDPIDIKEQGPLVLQSLRPSTCSYSNV